MLVGAMAGAAHADAPPGYYDAVDETSALTLRSSLHEIIDDHLRFPYTSTATDTWDIINVADEDALQPGNILDLYLNASYPKIAGGTGAYNREHSWPKSYGFPSDNAGNYPYTDAHHLFAADAGYNSSRNNHPFLDCDASCNEKVTLATNGRGGGSGIYPGNSNWTRGSSGSEAWQTWGGRQGDVARALFYMAVRYEGGLHGATGREEPDLELTDDIQLIESSNTGANEAFGYMGMLSHLVQWHASDPVDDLERRRNDVVFGFQGNRNPFVDKPAWADCIFADDCSGLGSGGGGGGGGGPIVVLASSELYSGSGTVSGSYLYTQVSDDQYQRIVEGSSGGKPSRRTSVAEHTWLFQVAGAKQAELSAELAFDVQSDDSHFVMEMSADGSSFTPAFSVQASPVDQLYTHSFNTGSGGTLYLRLVDADRTAGALGFDEVRVDALRLTYSGDGDGDTVAPAAPQSLLAVATDGRVALSWADNSEPDLAGYIAYRAGAASGPFDPLTAGLLTAPEYVDHTAENGVTYHYAVAAVDGAGNESALSAVMQATPETGPATGTFSIGSIELSGGGRKWIKVSALVTVVDAGGEAVAGAVVTGSFGGDLSETLQGTSDSAGVITFSSGERLSAPASATFCVESAAAAGLVFQGDEGNCASGVF